uniref:Uncharacterized protein n=1 Tax=Vespula pensylvanica TaxID=30213 RepID=A0A834JN83_VESPE|nr:hypothetical protein H0235_017743 [Vespula pensylvanica]
MVGRLRPGKIENEHKKVLQGTKDGRKENTEKEEDKEEEDEEKEEEEEKKEKEETNGVNLPRGTASSVPQRNTARKAVAAQAEWVTLNENDDYDNEEEEEEEEEDEEVEEDGGGGLRVGETRVIEEQRFDRSSDSRIVLDWKSEMLVRRTEATGNGVDIKAISQHQLSPFQTVGSEIDSIEGVETLTDREEDWKRKSKGEIRRGEEGRMSLTLFSAKSNDYHMFLRYGTEKDFNPIRR